MEYGFGTEGYYKKMLELQDKLRKSEEERLILEEKFNEMMQLTRDTEHDRLRLMRHRYHKFLEEDKIRQERNEQILQALDRIENRARMIAAKTQRFKAFRKQYEAYIKRIYRLKPEPSAPLQSYVSNSPTERSYAKRKLFSDMPENTETVEGKLAMLEQYLRDNFANFPPELSPKSPVNNNRLFEEQNIPRNGFYNQNNLEKLEPESEESDYNKYSVRKYNDKPVQKILSPKKNELLGNTIEKELERLKHKEPVKLLQRDNSIELKSPERVIEDYKELVSKSEEKFGLRGESPIRKTTPPEENVPNFFDNTTKTLNMEELKNISEKDVQKKVPIQQENIDSESENPVIKNYKQMLKSLNDDVLPNENDLKINDAHLSPANVVKENSEHSKQEDISDRTEPPEDISLNLTSEPLPIEKIDLEKPTNLAENIDNDISIDESTIKEQFPTNLENEQKLEPSINSQEIKIDSNQNNRTEIPEQEMSNKEPACEEQNYNAQNYSQETIEKEVYQEYDTTQQPVYTEDYNQQNIPAEGYDQQQYQPEYDAPQQPEYTESYEQQNISDPNYPEGYDLTQENQQPFPEGYDQNQQEYDQTQPEYVDPKYYPEQQQSDQVYDQQFTEQQPVYQEGYDQQYDASQYPVDQQNEQQYPQDQQYPPDQQYPTDQQYTPDQQYPTDEQYPPDEQQYPADQQYDAQQYPADQQYQEYPDQQYQPEQYDQQYSQEQIPGNVYSTEQEYLEGEQNIDKQYENEQIAEYQPEQYSERYAVQEQNIEGDNQKINSESTEQAVSQHEVDDKTIVEKKLPNLADMLDTDTSESIKQETKVSNESDFDFSKS